MHPPLRLTLTTPEEPGFLLERVQVYSMQEVWAVLEIVRDQCWHNETLNGMSWLPEAIAGPAVTEDIDTGATEEELRGLLTGRSISFRAPRVSQHIRHLYSPLDTGQHLCPFTRRNRIYFPRAPTHARNGHDFRGS